DPECLAVISSGFIVCLALYFPMFVVSSFALKYGIAAGIAAWLLPIIKLFSVLGRIILDWLADYYGISELYVPYIAAAGALVCSFRAAINPRGIVTISILYPFFSSLVISLYFPAVCALDPHVGSTGIRLGIACLPVGVISLIGTPIAQALVGQGGYWWRGIAFAGAAELVSAMLLAFTWTVQKGRNRSGDSGRK
ncbi:hypothetical protein LX32DRAFT_602575, partial [Colletotrichum zoysiae]